MYFFISENKQKCIIMHTIRLAPSFKVSKSLEKFAMKGKWYQKLKTNFHG